MIGNLKPPEGWRDRDDARDFKRAVTRLAYAEAEVLRCEEQLRVRCPDTDYWEALYDWADEAYELLAQLGAARTTRDNMARDAVGFIVHWHDQDRRAISQ